MQPVAESALGTAFATALLDKTPKKPVSLQQVAETALGNTLTQMLSEEGHQAVQRICESAVYLESDTNVAKVEITKAIKATNWSKVIDEVLGSLGIKNKHAKAKLVAAINIEKRQQLACWERIDATIHFLAGMPQIQPENLVSVAGVYDQELLDTNVNSAILGVIQLQCPDMDAKQKRRFAKLLELTFERQKGNLAESSERGKLIATGTF